MKVWQFLTILQSAISKRLTVSTSYTLVLPSVPSKVSNKVEFERYRQEFQIEREKRRLTGILSNSFGYDV